MSRGATPVRAFTIIEMVIVLTVLGLIVGVTAPRFVNNSARAQARNATRGLVDALTAHRAETIRSMAPSRLFFVSSSLDSGSISLVEVSSGAAEGETTGDTLTSMLAERGRIIEPFRLLGVWNGVALASPEGQGEGKAPWEVRTLIFEPTGRVSTGSGKEQTGDGGEVGDNQGQGPRLALVTPRRGDTIWYIQFDPISGAPLALVGSDDQ